MGTWTEPSRQFKAPAAGGNRDIDITCLGLTNTANLYDLKQVLECVFIDDPGGNATIDWPNSTPILLKVIADPGDAWTLEVRTRDHEGVGTRI